MIYFICHYLLLMGSLGEGARLPSIFRVKRIVKKRKGSERSKNSDRDSGPEAETANPPVTPAPRDSRDKGSTGGKRRPKKSTIETPKVCCICFKTLFLKFVTKCGNIHFLISGSETRGKQ